MSKSYVKILNTTDANRCNCVLWVRKRVPNLPFGLWTILSKKKIINSDKAKEGRVAIMNVGLPFGHVGIVKEVGKNHITIQEANYKLCKVTERHGTEKDLKILGYFNPNK
ncbi:MAG: CHAP domain-containing protein [Desulfitobacteriaceae bacterium]|nr:CHAP domain-containing protein [Desulfitobacteriaceae bacterium]